MELDFSVLENLGTDASNQSDNCLDSEPQLSKTAANNIEREQKNNAHIQTMYSEYMQNRNVANVYIPQLLIGLKEGQPIEKLFLKACECISKMTGEKVFYDQIVSNLTTIYGEAFMQKGALEILQESTQSRLDLLEEAYKTETRPTAKRQIQSAIQQHKRKLSELELMAGLPPF